MFDSIRNHKRYLLGFLMILIVPAFVLVGVQGFTDFNPRDEVVASVGGSDITRGEWDRAHREEAQRIREANPTLDPALLDEEEFRYATLERLVRDRLLGVAADKMGLYTSDQRLARALQDDPNISALRRADGSLDVEAYRQLVARIGMTPEMFEANQRADLSRRQVGLGVSATGFVPADLAHITLNAFFQQREVRLQRFDASAFAAQVQPSDADIEAFYQANGALFQAPEQADVEYLVLDAAAIADGVVLNEADVRSYYEQNAARLSGAEERRASHVLVSIPAGASDTDKQALREKADAVRQRLVQAPQSLPDVAKAESQDPGSASLGGDLGYFGRGAMVKPFEDAVFSLDKGVISEVVETDFGFHIIQVTDIKLPTPKPFEEMRAQIEADFKQQEAQKRFAEVADSFSNLVYEQADSLEPAAKELGLRVQTYRGLTRQPGPDAGPLAHPRLLEALFSTDSTQNKRNTEAVETGSGQLSAARIVTYAPARTLPLAEVREPVRQRLIAQRAAELAREAGEKQLAQWKGGAAADDMAAAVLISRDKPQNLPSVVLNAAMSAPTTTLPAWAGVSLGDQGYVVVKVEKVLPRAPRESSVPNQEVGQLAQWWTMAESEAYYEVLKERFKVEIKVPAPKLSTN